MEQNIIGRLKEKRKLAEILDHPEFALTTVYGRRRIGKTWLIREFCDGKGMTIQFTGRDETQDPGKTPTETLIREDIEEFYRKLKAFKDPKYDERNYPRNWGEAFTALGEGIDYYRSRHPEEKILIFIDEIPWLDYNGKSDFMRSFARFINSEACAYGNLKIFVCGSATAWMINKFTGDERSQYRRTLYEIPLKPFTLLESKLYLESKGLQFTNYQVMEIYMVFGGVASYMQPFTNGDNLSVPQLVDKYVFQQPAMLREFDLLYRAMFDGHEVHKKIIKALGNSSKMLGRPEIVETAKIGDGDSTSRALRELVESDIIYESPLFGHADRVLYRIKDFFSVFHLYFLETTLPGNRNGYPQNYFAGIHGNASYNTFKGLTFEMLCFTHRENITAALNLQNCSPKFMSWKAPKKDGAQIDMLIDRSDNTVNICEMKFYGEEITSPAGLRERMENRRTVFRTETNTTKNIYLSLISPYGARIGTEHQSYINQNLTGNEIFF